MLPKDELIKLLRNKKYSEILNIFQREYKQILLEFELKNRIKVDEKTTLCDLICNITNNFPDLSDYTEHIVDAFFNEGIEYEEALDIMIRNFKKTKEIFK